MLLPVLNAGVAEIRPTGAAAKQGKNSGYAQNNQQFAHDVTPRILVAPDYNTRGRMFQPSPRTQASRSHSPFAGGKMPPLHIPAPSTDCGEAQQSFLLLLFFFKRKEVKKKPNPQSTCAV